MGPLAIDMYLPALPTIAPRVCTPTTAAVQVSLAVYFVGIAIGQAFYGPLSDAVGRKPALYFGLVVFIAVVDRRARWRRQRGRADRVPVPAGARRLRAARRAARRRARPLRSGGSMRMLSVLMLVMGLAPILAPLIGGQLLINFGWRSVFWLLATYGDRLARSGRLLPARKPAGVARRRRQPIGDVLSIYARLAARPHVHGLRAVRRADLRGPAGLHLRLAVRLHRAVSRAARALRPVLRRQRDRDHRRLAGQPLAGDTRRGAADCRRRAAGGDGREPRAAVRRLQRASADLPASSSRCSASSRATASCCRTRRRWRWPPHGQVAGSASALLGTIQFVLGATTGALVGVARRTAPPSLWRP